MDGTPVRIVGLSTGNNGQGVGDVDFGLMMAGGTLQIYQRGAQKLGGISLMQGDRLRVSVEGGVIKYSRDGVLVYTSSLAPTYPLLVDTSILTPGAQIVGTTISGSSRTSFSTHLGRRWRGWTWSKRQQPGTC